MLFLLKKRTRIAILIMTSVLVILSLIGTGFVKTNYDMTTYLDEDSNTYQGIQILDQTFGNKASIELMVTDLDLPTVLSLKDEIKQVEYVEQVVFLDDYVDLNTTPLSFIPDDIKNNFIIGENMRLQIIFEYDSYDKRLDDSINEIKSLTDGYMRGDVLENKQARFVASNQLFLVMAIIVPVCVLILIIASRSFVEALLILVVLGVAIALNMGTNILLPNISFITMTMAMALQLAMSLDYSLFLVHRFHEEKGTKDVRIIHALKQTFKSITASSLTTVFGFIALMFMQYKIGFDIGFVLSKGIIFSYLSVIFLMPIGLYYCADLIEKTTHRQRKLNIHYLSNFIFKGRWIMGFVFLLILFVGLFFSSQSSYLYQGSFLEEGSSLYEDAKQIEAVFGINEPVVILIKGDDVTKELALVSDLSTHPSIQKIDALVTVIDPNTPRSFIPDEIKGNYINNGYTRMIVFTNIKDESSAYFDLDTFIRTKTNIYFDEAYFIGKMPATADIKSMVLDDTLLVLILSISLVFLVIMIVFKSLVLPLLLVIVIEASIWFNLSFNVLSDTPILYIGYLVIASIQLGATIDYAVLLSSRYIESRKTQGKIESFKNSIESATPTLIVSALILSMAGIIEYIVSDMAAIKAIGLLLFRGTLIAFVLVVFVLPFLLYVFDRFIIEKNKSQ